MKNIVKKTGYTLLFALALVQFWRPAKNLSNDQSAHLRTKYPVSAELDQLFAAACYDCHSNLTRYPWYAHVQPVGIWLAQHVNEGKKHFNFSNFTNRKIAVQNHKFEEIIEMVDEGSMPLNSYTWTHGDAKLSPEQRKMIVNWAKSMMDTLKNNYPADSLILRRK